MSHEFSCAMTWLIAPFSVPTVLRPCNKCGRMQHFVSSEKFRVNANGKSITAWLIYSCVHCKTTWKLKIFSPKKIASMDKTMFQALIDNDPALAFSIGFHKELLAQSQGKPEYADVAFDVIGPNLPNGGQPFELRMTCPVAFPLRLHKIFVQKTGISRTKFSALCDAGAIRHPEGKDLGKYSFQSELVIYVDPISMHRIIQG